MRNAAAAIWFLVVVLLTEVALLMFSKLDMAGVALAHVLVFSAVAFVLFAWDKLRAIRNGTRVPEATLFTIAIAGGALGGVAAMLLARHKTRRPLFWIVVCTSLFVHVTLVGWLFIARR